MKKKGKGLMLVSLTGFWAPPGFEKSNLKITIEP
jgi:hypothetical protein